VRRAVTQCCCSIAAVADDPRALLLLLLRLTCRDVSTNIFMEAGSVPEYFNAANYM
jgi:hypothetical protein